ncbi:MAG: beta-glucosidase, partial [Geminicoccaceae bacterium]|nr:beta-glucosidase [Geminicoccaceae bacterium]
LINHRHCVANPNGHAGYGEACWGLTASDDPWGYEAHAPDRDRGVITPTAAIASMPYTPALSLAALRHFMDYDDGRLWTDMGFVDAFCPAEAWRAGSHLAIDQGPIVVMIENHRSGLLWRLFMSCPEIRDGLRRLGFTSPHLGATSA